MPWPRLWPWPWNFPSSPGPGPGLTLTLTLAHALTTGPGPFTLTLVLTLALTLTPTLSPTQAHEHQLVAKGGTGNHATSGLKFLLLIPWLKVGCNVLLSDVDVVYLRDPFQAQPA